MTHSSIDLAFLMDCTCSMGPYIKHAIDNINRIADELIRSEKCRLRLALVEYRDHEPQDMTFVTRINDFTEDIAKAKQFISNASAEGGGDFPEAICCALYDGLNSLTWKDDAIKIAILIADAPPHGLRGAGWDMMPDGCPKQNDPVDVVCKMAERAITLYTVGCEPSLEPYRHFFQALSLIAGGKYVPLEQADNLSMAIIGGTREEVSMEKLMSQVHEEVMREAADKGEAVNEDVLTKRIHDLLNSQGSKINTVKVEGNVADVEVTGDARELSKLKSLKEFNDYIEINNVRTVVSGGLGKPRYYPVFPKSSKSKRIYKSVATDAKVEEAKTDDGLRRSKRLAGKKVSIAAENVSIEHSVPKKPKLEKKSSSSLELSNCSINMDQARRLVKKSLARKKISK